MKKRILKRDESIFDMFRFQLNKTDTNLTLIENANIPESKNQCLEEVLGSKYLNFGEDQKYNIMLQDKNGTIIVLKMNAEKKKTHNKRDFSKSLTNDYPYILLIINNDPDQQIIFVEHNSSAFNSTNTPIRLIEELINHGLRQYHYAIAIEPMYIKEEYKQSLYKFDDIVSIEFEIVRKNMSKFKYDVVHQLKTLQNDTNSDKTKIAISNSSNTPLTLQGNSYIDELLDYTAEGGGEAKYIRRGNKKKSNYLAK